MIGLRNIVDLLARCAEYVRAHVPPPEWWPSALTLAVILMAAGFVLAFWGNRLLRLVYVLTFIALGGAVGVSIARAAGVDLLIGLVLGAGIAGLAGHLLFRWWVGMTSGICAAVFVLAFAAGRNSADLQTALSEYARNHPVAIPLSQPAEAPAASDGSSPTTAAARQIGLALKDSALGAFRYFSENHQGVVARVVVVTALAWITGLGMGLCLPRFTTILGTSCLGVALLALGLGMLLFRYSPAALEAFENNDKWVFGVLGVLLLMSLIMQARQRRTTAQPPAAPVPVPKAA
jgi:hypothetical protein